MEIYLILGAFVWMVCSHLWLRFVSFMQWRDKEKFKKENTQLGYVGKVYNRQARRKNPFNRRSRKQKGEYEADLIRPDDGSTASLHIRKVDPKAPIVWAPFAFSIVYVVLHSHILG